jgi:hypothetical protein
MSNNKQRNALGRGLSALLENSARFILLLAAQVLIFNRIDLFGYIKKKSCYSEDIGITLQDMQLRYIDKFLKQNYDFLLILFSR